MKHGRLRVFLPALGCAAMIGLFVATPASMMRDGESGFVYSTPRSIAEAQSILVQAGYLNASAYRQGELDKATVSALLDFQRVHSLRRTGVVDWETMSLLPAHAHGKGARLFEGSKRSLVLEGVNFETDSDTLTASSHATLDRVAQSLNAYPDIRVEIAGHTDSLGGADHNMQLSAARADSVKRYLVSRGVDGSRLVAKGYGDSMPVADNDTASGRAKNRRVELKRID
ncbi:MAG TPA: OmpA family protein [Candidatus Polarisedimenticolia bacterium]|jgi:outer membrane protein OmpA-like peptidoglycan-associated protein|nr:OmpA family protein [Candidatus Polarisedimenticolia bacterium]